MESVGLLARLNSTLFWDVDLRDLDAATHARFIISRVMERGGRSDVLAVWQHYGAASVCEALLDAPSLDAKTITFFANQFGLAPSEFRAYGKRQEMGTWVR